jgi:alginate O-acetyltransferase complex protein AlgI
LWRRWHISLSTWARDYIYYPLAVSLARMGRAVVYFAVFVTFVLIGLWHGAAWTFVMMGVVFGGYIIIGAITKPWRLKFAKFVGLTKMPVLYEAMQIGITFLLSCIGWIFFRAQSIQDAFYFVGHLGTGWSQVFTAGLANAMENLSPAALPEPTFSIALFSAVLLMVTEFLELRYSFFSRLKEIHPWSRWIAYYGLALIFLLFFLTVGTYEQKAFIYFQF